MSDVILVGFNFADQVGPSAGFRDLVQRLTDHFTPLKTKTRPSGGHLAPLRTNEALRRTPSPLPSNHRTSRLLHRLGVGGIRMVLLDTHDKPRVEGQGG